MTNKEFLEKIKETVLSYDGKAEVILFGSRARGDFRNDSDWDILIITESEADYLFQRKIRDEICDIELAFRMPVSTIIVNKNKWKQLEVTPLYKNVIAEGKAV